LRTTEESSRHSDLENKSTLELLKGINEEDKTVALSVEKAIPQILPLVDIIAEKMKNGGRLFYIGSGTSGRLGIVDASECPPTFGIEFDKVIGIIAGGDTAIRRAVENAEDNTVQGWIDLKQFDISDKDVLIGIAASGSTPYVVSALKSAQENKVVTGCITCNLNSPLSKVSNFPIEVVVGPEFVTGSTRMKAGTAQKLVLNMISTSVMIKLGKIKGNKMVDMQLTNQKLIERGTKMVMNELNIDESTAKDILLQKGSVRKAIDK
jgi:N-acetylmuramic acid 6-phosphate etherase